MLSRNLTRLFCGISLAVVACAPASEPDGTDANIGTATLELRLAPPDVKCLVVTVTNPSYGGVQSTFGLSGAASTSLLVTGLPIGTDTFQAQAYTVPCAQWTTSTAAFVQTGSVTATVMYDPPVNVVLTMKSNSSTNGSATVTAEFPNPSGVITEFTLPTANAGPRGITVGADGALWFTEGNTHAIGTITVSGTITETVLTQTGTPGQIVTGPYGDLWFTDDIINFGIGRTSPDHVVRTFPQGFRTGAITVGSDRNIYFTNVSTGGIVSISPLGVTHAFTAPGTGFGLTGGSDGRLWFTDGLNKIGAMTTAGVVTEYAIPSGGGIPASIVAGPDDNLWFSEDSRSAIGRVSTSGAFAEFTVPSTKGAAHIAAGPDGNLWFAENNPAALASITRTGTITEFKIQSSTCPPTSIVAGPDGNVWFTENACNKIGRLTPP